MTAREPVVLLAERRGQRIVTSPSDMDELRWRGATVPSIACMPVTECMAQWIDAPYRSFSRAKRVFPTLLDIAMPFPIEECEVEFLEPQRGAGGNVRALAVAARHSHIEARLAGCRDAGFDPMILDHEGLAIWTQSLAETPAASADAFRAVLRADPGRSVLVIGRGRSFIGAQTLPGIGTETLSRALRTRLGAAPVPVFWALCGAEATDRTEAARILSALPDDWVGSSCVHESPAEFAARAFACRALLRGPLRVDLRGVRFRHPDSAKRAGRDRNRALWLVAAAGFLLCAAASAAVLKAGRMEREADATFASLRDSLLGYSLPVKGERAISVVAAELTTRKENARPFRDTFTPSLVTLAGRLTEIADRDGLRLATLNLSGRAVDASGMAPRWNAWSEFVRQLGDSGYAVAVKTGNAGPDGRIPFTVVSAGGADR